MSISSHKTPLFRPDLIALGIMVLLGLGQFLGFGVVAPSGRPQEAIRAFSGFGQAVIFTLLGLFILTRALTYNGLMGWLGERLARASARSLWQLTLFFSALAALLSLGMNNIAVGALMLPVAIQAARRLGIYPSKVLIPIAFGTALGGMATYFTTANIVMSNLLTSAQPPQPPLGMLSFLPIGGLIALLGLGYIALFAPRLLPERRSALEQALARRSEADLERLYALGERLWEVRLDEHSPLIGKTIIQSGLGQELGLAIVAIWRGRRAIFAPAPSEHLQVNDILLVVGREDRVQRLAQRGCLIGRERRYLSSMEVTLLEILPSPHASVLGKTLKQINFRRRYGFTAVALLRRGRSYRTDVGDYPLELGDTLLVVGPAEEVDRLREDGEWIVLEAEATPPEYPSRRAIAALLLMILAILAFLFGVPAYLAVLGAALLALLFRLLPLDEAYRAIEWPTLFFIAGMYALSLALVQSGLAAAFTRLFLEALEHPSPLFLGGAAFWVAAALTQLVGSQATAFVVGPLVISTAIHLGINPQAIAVATAIGCSASFVTPISHPVNMIMVNPGNYRFGDFARLGWGVMLTTFLGLILGLHWIWGL